MANSTHLEKKKYATPHLTVHGDVEALTQQAPGCGHPNHPSNPRHASRNRLGIGIGVGAGLAILGEGGSERAAAPSLPGLFS